MPKVSIIIPVYGVEQYIERCARSLFEQDFEDIEYIFINDCTKDASIEVLQSILSEYPSRIAQTKIINLEQNKGLAFVRKLGLENATGDYIIACDSDDYIETDMISSLYKVVEDNMADCVLCEYYEEFKGQVSQSSNPFSSSGEELIRLLLFNKIPGFIWRVMCSKDLYSTITTYPIYSFAEDIVMNVQLWSNAKSMCHVNRPLYHYCLRSGSLSTNKEKSALLYQVESCNWVTNFVSEYLRQFECFESKYADALVYFKRSLVASRFTAEEKYLDKDIRPIFKSASKVNMLDYLRINGSDISIKEKIVFLLDVLNIIPLYYWFKQGK